jgi:hypothetical protein
VTRHLKSEFSFDTSLYSEHKGFFGVFEFLQVSQSEVFENAFKTAMPVFDNHNIWRLGLVFFMPRHKLIPHFELLTINHFPHGIKQERIDEPPPRHPMWISLHVWIGFCATNVAIPGNFTAIFAPPALVHFISFSHLDFAFSIARSFLYSSSKLRFEQRCPLHGHGTFALANVTLESFCFPLHEN